MEVPRFMCRVLTVLGIVGSTYGFGGYGGHGRYGGHGHGGYVGHGYGGYGRHISGGYGGHGYGGYGGYGHGGYGNVGYPSYGYQPYGNEGYGYDPYGYNDHHDSDGYEDDDDKDDDCKDGPKSPVCSMPKKPGNCKGSLIRFHFDKDAEKCKAFVFTGCGGNDNRFDTQEGCETFCKPKPCQKKEKKNKKKKHGRRHYGHHDHLYATKHNIDAYLANSYLLGKRRLSVQVDYLNTPLEYQYLNQYHGLKHPLTYSSLGHQFGLGYNHNSHGYNNQNSYGYNNQNSYGNNYQSPTTHVQGYSTNQQSYGTSPVGYGQQVGQTTYSNGYSQPAQNSYGSTKVYQQNAYGANAVPKQPTYAKVTAPKTQTNYYNQVSPPVQEQTGYNQGYAQNSYTGSTQGNVYGKQATYENVQQTYAEVPYQQESTYGQHGYDVTLQGETTDSGIMK